MSVVPVNFLGLDKSKMLPIFWLSCVCETLLLLVVEMVLDDDVLPKSNSKSSKFAPVSFVGVAIGVSNTIGSGSSKIKSYPFLSLVGFCVSKSNSISDGVAVGLMVSCVLGV